MAAKKPPKTKKGGQNIKVSFGKQKPGKGSPKEAPKKQKFFPKQKQTNIKKK